MNRFFLSLVLLPVKEKSLDEVNFHKDGSIFFSVMD